MRFGQPFKFLFEWRQSGIECVLPQAFSRGLIHLLRFGQAVVPKPPRTAERLSKFLFLLWRRVDTDFGGGQHVFIVNYINTKKNDSILLNGPLSTKTIRTDSITLRPEKYDTLIWSTNDTFILHRAPHKFIMNDNRCLNENDIDYMLRQQNCYSNFFWNNTLLGFNNNKQQWYNLSVPLFSIDRNKVIIKVVELCPGLCGHGNTILYKKVKNEWQSTYIETWFH